VTQFISKDMVVCGFPARKIRAAFRRLSEGTFFNAQFLEEKLGLEPPEAEKLVRDLLQEEFIEPDEEDPGWWGLAPKGMELRKASATKPMPREKADELLAQFLDRVHEVRDDPYWLFEVEEARVFGSYLDESCQSLGDLDLVYRLVRREPDQEKHRALMKERARVLVRDAGYGRNLIEWIAAGEIEVDVFLHRGKARRKDPRLSFHSPSDRIVASAPARVIYSRSR
jgi:hypothetical protein